MDIQTNWYSMSGRCKRSKVYLRYSKRFGVQQVSEKSITTSCKNKLQDKILGFPIKLCSRDFLVKDISYSATEILEECAFFQNLKVISLMAVSYKFIHVQELDFFVLISHQCALMSAFLK